jgi:hypothetical protein
VKFQKLKSISVLVKEAYFFGPQMNRSTDFNFVNMPFSQNLFLLFLVKFVLVVFNICTLIARDVRLSLRSFQLNAFARIAEIIYHFSVHLFDCQSCTPLYEIIQLTRDECPFQLILRRTAEICRRKSVSCKLGQK